MTGAPDKNEPDEAQRLREKEALMERLLMIAAGIKANMPGDVTSDHGWLYGEDGLPA
ncbi:MAG: hypothetical protein ABSC06_29475 [Rhodopila sp.]|jgi:hypothetical protein